MMTANIRDSARPLLLVATSFLAAAIPNAALAQVSFVAREDYPAGTNPRAVVAADLNSDGRLDLILANNGSNDVSVLLGRSDGTFSPASRFAAGTGPQSVAVGDFNGDGRPDLAVANSGSNNVSMLLGNGDGTFQAAQTLGAGTGPQAIVVGDFNGDGRPDLAVANSGSNSVSVLLGNGDGTFQAAQTLGAGTGPQAIAVGDFNGDGRPDLAVADYSVHTISVLLGNGDGTFRAPLSFAAGNNPSSLASGDFNRDGRLDLAVADVGSNTVSVLLGNGDGTFQAVRAFVADSGATSVAVGDFNRDGLVDLAVTAFYANTVSLLRGNGDGTFQAPAIFGAGTRPWSVAAGDFNGDGALDLTVANDGSATVSLLRNRGDGTFPVAPVLQVGNQPSSAAVGDFNGDGVRDLAVADYSTDSVSVLRGNGDGTFQAALTFAAGGGPWSVSVADLNRDGIQDLAVADNRSNAVSVLLGRGDGTFGAALSFAADLNPTSVAAGDFNRDGRADLAVANSNSNTVSILLGNGDGTFQAARNVIAGSGPSSVAVGDFNGDGLADLAVTAYYSNLISVLLGNGDGTFQTPRLYSSGSSNPWWLAVGDFNRDGIQDLAIAHYHSNAISTASVLLGNGDGTFRPALTFDVGAGAAYVAVGDFNGDGVPDLAVANYGSNLVPVLFVSVLLGNGDGTLQPARNFGAGPGPYSVAVGDFNGDGKPDLAVANFGSFTVSMLTNNTAGGSNTLTVSKAGTGSGTVTSNPTGINCGASCFASYPGGTVVTLTAAPDGSSTFTGWSGGGCSGTSTCTVTMTTPTVITATFTSAPPDTTPPTISGVTASAITATGATIGWTTNEASDSQVEYGPTTAYGSSTALNSSLVTSHSQTLSSLAASTLYHYRVKSKDAAGNLATSGDFTFTTPAPPDTTPPTISGVTASAITSTGATIGWTTNEASDSQVEYGPTTGYGSSTALNSSLVTSHSQALSSLAASTLYHYRVKSKDASGNLAVSPDSTFTTSAASGGTQNVVWINLVNVTATGNSIQKTGGCDGCADAGATSQQQIASGDGYLEFTIPDSTKSLTFALASGVSAYSSSSMPLTIQTNGAGTAEVYESGVWQTGTTQANNDVFRIATVSGVVEYSRNGAVFYTSGATPAYPLVAEVPLYSAGSQVTNAVISTSAPPPSDTTPPTISGVTASAITATGATIGWTTNEASDSQVEYGPTTAYGSSTALNSSLVTSHSQTLSSLAASTLYHYRVKSKDAAGNLATSGDFTFTTPAPPDTTPPTISAVTASGITSTGATIAWTTNEASDSQVEYGPTTAYGSSTALNSSLVTSHSQTLSSLAASTLYHYRVKSKDAAGNLATSGDFTFTTAAGAALSAPVLKWSYGGCLSGPWCDTGWYSSPAVVDLDGDGQPDVIWGGYDAVALRGDNGSLKWRGASNNRIWPGIAIADLTSDGTPEVIVGRGNNELTVYNRSGGVVWTRNPFASGNEVRSLAVTDLETDGQVEIIVGRAGDGATGQVNVFEPNGTVRAGWPARHAGEPGYGDGMYNENLAIADLNADGYKEVFGPTSSYINAFARNGSQLGTSSIYNSFSPVGPKVWSQVGVNVDQAADLRGYANCGVENRPDFSYSAPSVADVNGDGVPELIVVGNVYDCNTYTDLYHIPFILKLDRTRWSGSGFDWTVVPTPRPGSAPRSEDYTVIEDVVPSPAVADLDGDGFKEIIYPSYDGRVHAFWLDKTEHGSWPYTIPTSGAPGDDFRFASEPVIADLDNDGHAEVIFTSWPKKGTGAVGQLIILNYLGVELFRVDLPGPDLASSENGGLSAPTLANIDSDPDLEVVVGTISSGAVAYELPNTANARILWGTGRGSYRRTGTAAPP